MANFNFLAPRATPTEIKAKPAIRTRATAKDRYDGLRGHAYIAARQEEARAALVQTSALHHARG
jgi:hypothetical protein